MVSVNSRQVVIAALACCAVTAAAKLVAVFHSGSSALLSSTVHSLIDMSALALLLHGLRQADATSARADGFGRDPAMGFWSFVVGIPLYAMGAGVALHEGIERLSRPQLQALAGSEWPILALGAVAAGIAAWLALTRLQHHRGAGLPLVAIARAPANSVLLAVLIIATGSVLGQVLALAGVAGTLNGLSAEVEPAASVVIGLVLAAVAAAMAIEVKRLLAMSSAEIVPPAETIEMPAPLPAPSRGIAVAAALETKALPSSLSAAASAAASPSAATGPTTGPKPQIVARGHGKGARGKRR